MHSILSVGASFTCKKSEFLGCSAKITHLLFIAIFQDSVAVHQRELHQTTAENQETWPLDLYSFMPPNKIFTTKDNSKPYGALKLSMSLLPSKNDDLINILDNEGKENLTLELFPIWRNDQTLDVTAKEDIDVSSLKNIITRNEFFEFLPPKNW